MDKISNIEYQFVGSNSAKNLIPIIKVVLTSENPTVRVNLKISTVLDVEGPTYKKIFRATPGIWLIYENKDYVIVERIR